MKKLIVGLIMGLVLSNSCYAINPLCGSYKVFGEGAVLHFLVGWIVDDILDNVFHMKVSDRLIVANVLFLAKEGADILTGSEFDLLDVIAGDVGIITRAVAINTIGGLILDKRETSNYGLNSIML